jgi:acetyltransferase-like isoleucine patch superfamily enzyme
MSEGARGPRGLAVRGYGWAVRATRAAQLSVWRAQGARLHPSVLTFGRVTHIGPLDRLRIGPGSTLNQGVHLNLHDRITIGADVHVSAFAQLHSGYLVPDEIPRRHDHAPIVIEDHAWIAAGAIIGAGVTVGRGAVVAAGAVVVEDVPPGTLVAGVPAREVRRLQMKVV